MLYRGRCDCVIFFFFKQKTAYEMCGRDWSSDVCSSDLRERERGRGRREGRVGGSKGRGRERGGGSGGDGGGEGRSEAGREEGREETEGERMGGKRQREGDISGEGRPAQTRLLSHRAG